MERVGSKGLMRLKLVVDTDIIGTVPTNKCKQLFQHYLDKGWVTNKHLDKVFPRNAAGKPILRWETLRGFLRSICPSVDYSKIGIDKGYIEIPATATYTRVIEDADKKTLMNVEIIPAGTIIELELKGDSDELMKLRACIDGKDGHIGSRGKYGYGHVYVYAVGIP